MSLSKSHTHSRLQSYDIGFKLKVIQEASQSSNHATARKYGLDPKRIRDWKKQEADLRLMLEDQSSNGGIGNGPGKKRRRLDGAGRKPLLGILENELAEWIIASRASGYRVSYKDITTKALQLFPGDQFKASRGWIFNFLKRWNFTIQRWTTADQTLPLDCASRVATFLTNVRQIRNESKVPSSMIGNMDETVIWIDMPKNYIVDNDREVCPNDATSPNSGPQEKQRVTVVLGAMADGRKLPPLIVLKGKRIPREINELPGVYIMMSDTGWMSEEIVKCWLQQCWGKCCTPGVRILTWDANSYHVIQEIREQVGRMETKLCVIPRGCAKILQPADVSWNEQFRNRFRSQYKEWMSSGEKTVANPKGKLLRAPSELLLVSWIKTAWGYIARESIIDAFKNCGISLATDCSEDDHLRLGHDEKLTDEVKELVKSGHSKQDDATDGPFEDTEDGDDNEFLVDDDCSGDEL